MGFFSKLFSSDNTAVEPDMPVPKSFLECLDVVHRWSARAAIDPDFDMNDKNLNLALSVHVSCPYCNAQFQFGQAVTFKGAVLEVKCPACNTVPQSHYDNN